jgi:acyl-CoA reductase-like NAD-dependent aldehyde dehydrogenase
MPLGPGATRRPNSWQIVRTPDLDEHKMEQYGDDRYTGMRDPGGSSKDGRLSMIAERVLGNALGSGVVELGSFIAGRMEVPSAPFFEVLDPATSRLIARVTEAGHEGVSRAAEAGEAVFESWRRMPPRDRAALVDRFADRIEAHADWLAQLDSVDTGNPLTAMRSDVAKGVRLMREAAGLALEMKGDTFPLPGVHFTRREPWGVVGRMITFNHPSMFTCARLGSALVAGNCVVLKPSELAPLSPLAIGELSAGLLPDGVVNVVAGGPATGEALVRHPSVVRLSFTGSTATALRIQAAAAASGRVKTLSFELGGKNAIIIFPDVDLDEAAAAVVRGMNFTRVQGQSCGSTSRLIVHESIADAVLARAAHRARGIRIGLPLDPDTEMGSMITQAARDRSLGEVEGGIQSGARLLTGGHAPDPPELAAGAFMEPTIIADVAPGSRLAMEEVFGPVLAATSFTTEEEAVALANGSRYGLTGAVWTQDIDRAFRIADRLEAGYVWINDVETRFPGVPFGGWRDSGVGMEHGLEEILSFTRLRAVNLRLR